MFLWQPPQYYHVTSAAASVCIICWHTNTVNIEGRGGGLTQVEGCLFETKRKMLVEHFAGINQTLLAFRKALKPTFSKHITADILNIQ